MLEDLRIFLKGILPKSRGLRALGLCLLLIPFMTDLVLLFFQVKSSGNPVFMSGMLVSAYIRYFPFLILYLLGSFLGWYFLKKVESKIK
jgi:hypothetical protein